MTRIVTVFILILTVALAEAADAKSSKNATTYFEIEKLNAPCCATMLKYSLTNITGVASADIFITNRVVRVVHEPRKGIQKEFREAFLEGAITAKRLKKVSKDRLK